MEFEELLPGAWVFTPKQHGDDRGLFLEWYKQSVFTEAVGRPLHVAQANHSISRRGTVRAIHFAAVPPGQAKYVYCPAGQVLDVVVDIRVGSPTFGSWRSVVLDDVDRRCVYLAEGMGHGFVALSDVASFCYLVSEPYHPDREFTVSAVDETLAIDWGVAQSEIVLSARDQEAPSLAEAQDLGLLPSWDDCQAWYDRAK